MSRTTNIIMLGIGGQGMLTIMEMLASAVELEGEEVRVLSRVSLARLGGSGMCHVRVGPSSSAAIPVGEADILVALEMSEIVRALPLARRGALAFINTYRRLPIAAGVAGIHYPTHTEVEAALATSAITGIFVPETLTVSSASNNADSRINMIMLGVLCGYTQLIPRLTLEESIAQRLPRFAEQNLKTFAAGWKYGEEAAKGAKNRA